MKLQLLKFKSAPFFSSVIIRNRIRVAQNLKKINVLNLTEIDPLKFVFFKKATKSDEVFIVDLTLTK